MIRLASFFNVKELGTGHDTAQILQQTNTRTSTHTHLLRGLWHLCSKALVLSADTPTQI